MLTYDLDRTSAISLYDQLYRCIRADIESGSLTAGERLPSKRTLARHLGISPITVEGALAQLIAEGYVIAEERRGSFVAPFASAFRPAAAAAAQLRSGCSLEASPPREEQAHAAPDIADLTGATAPTGLFPYLIWARTVRAVLAEESEETLLAAAQPQGSYPLRAAIADHLRGFRGMDAQPERIVIGAGAQVLYQLIAQLLGPASRIALEDPGYPRLRRIYEALGMHTHPIPVISEGASLHQLHRAPIDAIHCMPSHHFPTGATMAAPARCALLEWAHGASGRYLIEDDYDCEFRMQGKPLAPLAALDGGERVIYLNTFTKSLGGAFRIGYMVLPQGLARAFRERLGFYSCTVGGIDQAALRRFMATGGYERHCNRLRTHYRRISRQLEAALREAVAPAGGTLLNVGAGLHFVMRIPALGTPREEAAFLCEAEAGGVRMRALSAFRHDAAGALRMHEGAQPAGLPRRAGERSELGSFLISFSSVEQARIPQIAEVVRQVLERGCASA